MGFATKAPPPGGDGGALEMSSLGGVDLQANIPNPAPAQDKFLLRLVPPSPPPRPRRLDVRISVADGRSPIGRTRPLRLTEHDLVRLIEAAQRLEAGR
jgi:hypothetical protein